MDKSDNGAQYKLELIVKEPLGFEGEMMFEGTTNDPGVAQAMYTLVTTREFAQSINIYKDGKAITSDELLADFRQYSKI